LHNTDMTKKNLSLILLSLLFVCHVVNNSIILRIDTTPINTDALDYYAQSIRCFRIVSDDNKGFLELFKIGFCNPSLAPLFSLSIFPFYALFGIGPDIACMSNVFFLAVLIFAIFSIAKQLLNAQAGIFATFILLSYPTVFGLSRWCMPAFASLSTVTLTFFWILRSNGFRNRKFCLLAGITAGLSMLIHLSSLFALILPYAFFLITGNEFLTANRKRKIEKRELFFNFFLSIAPAVITIGCWSFLCNHSAYVKQAAANNLPSFRFVLPGVILFIRLLIDTQIHIFFFLIVVISILILIVQKPKLCIFLLLWYVSNTFIVALFPFSRLPRVNIASLSALALISSLGIFSIHRPFLRRFCILLVICVGLLQYTLISYYPGAGWFYNIMIPLNIKARLIHDDQVNHHGLLQANTTDWHHDKIAAKILEDWKGPELLDVWIICAKASIHGALLCKVLEEKLPIRIINATNDPWGLGIETYNEQNLQQQLANTDYVLVYAEDVADTRQWPVVIQKTRQFFQASIQNFTLVDEIKMPDSRLLHIYKKMSVLNNS